MGLTYENLHMLLNARYNGAAFSHILTLGALEFFIRNKDKIRLSKKFGLDRNILLNTNTSNDFFIQFLGAKHVTAIDYSDYEKSTLIHDMNIPIAAKYHNSFDAVIDGGTLEHIFNFPTALENCLNVLKKGGNFFAFTMANNHLGHGFYQFSPELFFNVLSESYGLRLEEIVLVEHRFPSAELTARNKCYSVTDPKELRKRVGLVSKKPVMMMVHALKISEHFSFAKGYPIQSDYLTLYNNGGLSNPSKPFIKRLFSLLPKTIQNQIKGLRELRSYSFQNKRSFHKKRY
ncbi:MAG: methyltransferase domain-containing protein [Spirochaetales bacterium]|nr:methyltransferase domain-containing protein [Spirochaetales bacterium]